MIAEITQPHLSAAERSHFERIEGAVDVWREGRASDADLLVDAVLSERLSPRIAAKALVAKAGFRLELGDVDGSAQALHEAAPVVDRSFIDTQGCFYSQRGRIHRIKGEIDAALTDYSGAAVCWEVAGNDELRGAAHLNLAELYLGLDDLLATDENLNKAITIFEASQSFYLPQAYDTHAHLLLKSGKPGAALDAITIALSLAGDNEGWKRDFLQTRKEALSALLDSLKITTLEGCDRLKVLVTEKALRQSNGSLTKAGEIVGATRHAVDYIVDQNEELEPFRVRRRVRHKTLIKR